ncbi:MAG: autotransporter outer membrane beta-barrel domain-containing protein, partial [Planctomycetaceae bacterium]|jgi:outer membrane autotransporter protein|nr:autotransporter outer membrane beta-barrel domain-containing protein [Planctomycetaceae bacterium]
LHFLQSASTRTRRSSTDAITLGQSCDPCAPACDPCEPICEGGDSCDSCNSAGSFGLCGGSHYNTWFEGFGNFLRQSNTNALQGYRANSGGFNLGIDRQINKYTIVGFSFGGAYTDIKTNNRTQWGDVEQYLFAVYSSRTFGDVTLSLSGGYAHSEYKLTRNPGGTQLDSKHDGDQFFASFEIAEKIRYATYDLTPFLAFDYINLDEEGYGERDAGGGVQNTIKGQDSDSYLQTLGVRIGRTRYVNGWIVNPSLTAGWVHDYGSSNIYTTAQYTGGQQFTIKGAPMNKNRGLFGVNLNVAVSPNLTLFGRYDGEFSSKFQVQTAQAGLNYKF